MFSPDCDIVLFNVHVNVYFITLVLRSVPENVCVSLNVSTYVVQSLLKVSVHLHTCAAAMPADQLNRRDSGNYSYMGGTHVCEPTGFSRPLYRRNSSRYILQHIYFRDTDLCICVFHIANHRPSRPITVAVR